MPPGASPGRIASGPAVAKSAGAFRTIGEVAAATGLPQHILRYWETRFPQLRLVTRAGNRRYYRPDDVALVVRLDRLLNHDGYTVRGVQKLLAAERPTGAGDLIPASTATSASDTALLRAIRDTLKSALDAD